MDKEKIRKGITISLLLTFVSIFAIFLYNFLKGQKIKFGEVSSFYLLLGFLIVFVRCVVECLRFRVLCWAFGHLPSFRTSCDVVLGGWFFTILPAGGALAIPYQVYLLQRDGMSIGKAGGALALRGITILISLLPVSLVFYSRVAELSKGLKSVSHVVYVIYGLLILFLFYVMFFTDDAKRRLDNLILKVKSEKAKVALERLKKEVDLFKMGFKECFTSGKWKFLLVLFLGFVSVLLYAVLAPVTFYGLGVSVNTWDIMFLQMIYMFLSVFYPTPGASGLAEGTAYGLFRQMCPPGLEPVFIALWRFFTYYLFVIIGAFFVFKVILKSK